MVSMVRLNFDFAVVTIGRAYTNRANREYYHMLFDEAQKSILSITSKPLRFKRLSRGGNLRAMGVDLEAAQVLGAGDSFLPTNQPEYSGIHTVDAEEIVQYFTRACFAHVKRCSSLLLCCHQIMIFRQTNP
jgi:hypothetical protein